MSYFSLFKIFKFAAAERKIKDYGITDPFLKILISSNENAIAWNGYEEKVLDANGNPILEENGEEKTIEKEIENENDVNEYVRKILLADLKSKCDPNSEKNHYVKGIDMAKLRKLIPEGTNLDFDDAYNIFLQDANEGTKKYLTIINEQKKGIFNRWLEFFADNEEYQKQPAFIYLLLSKIVNSSSAKTIKPPPSYNPFAVSKMHVAISSHPAKFTGTIQDPMMQREIKSWDTAKPTRDANGNLIDKETIAQLASRLNQQESDILEFLSWEYIRSGDYVSSYTDALSKYNQELTQSMGGVADGDWVLFPKKDTIQPKIDENGEEISADDVFDRNLDYLDALSQPIGWCTTKGRNGPSYTTSGNFYAFVRNGRAECAIRFVGDQLVEFAGDQSTGQYYVCPTKNYREIIKKVEDSGWVDKIAETPQGKPFWRQILQEKSLNADFFNADGSPNMEEINNFIGFIEKDPRNYNRVDVSNFARAPEVLSLFQNACRTGWMRELEEQTVGENASSVEKLLKWGKDVPQFLQEEQAFIDGLHSKVATLYVDNPLRLSEVHRYLPNHLSLYPQGKNIFKNAVIQKYERGYGWLSKATKKYQSENVKQNIARADNFMQQLSTVIETCYTDLRNDTEFEAMKEQTNLAAIPQLIQEGYLIKGMPKEQVNEAFADEQFVNNFIQQTLERVQNLPNEIKGFAEKRLFDRKFLDQFVRSRIPKVFQKNPIIKSSVDKIIYGILKNNIANFKEFDESFKENDLLYQAYKQYIFGKNAYLLYINHGAKYFDEKLLSDPDFQEAIRSHEVTNVGIDKIIRSVTANPAAYVALVKSDPQTAANAEIIEAYIRRRVRIPNALQRQPIIFEYKELPQSVKDMEEVKKSYLDNVAYLLTAAMPGTKFYINCDNLDPIAFEDERIVSGCQKRKDKLQRRAQGTWYKKSINSMWGYVIP